jgi:hypothetical protein
MNGASARLYAAVFGWSVIAVGVWLWMTAYGFKTYKTTDNFRYTGWPTSSRISRADDRPTLLFFIHPRCPCTRASVAEIERLLAGHSLTERQLPAVVVVATIPSQAPMEWRDTNTLQRAMHLPNATLFWDYGGEESKLFGAIASGTVMLHRQDGTRTFAGGVTAARGHEGDNVGSERLFEALVDNHSRPLEPTPAFGCRLWTSKSEEVSAVKND